MKRNLNDYKKEMKEMQTRSDGLHKEVSSQVNHTQFQKRERPAKAPLSTKWAKLMPGLMAILMAILTLIFLIISEVLKNH
jgi:hypothetical protein